ncbi:MAG: DNA polymerase III subunit delta' [Betaproteobacteria bacterium RBG_16_58_11]|nr:MAG: DNA polymerase III subunit delta' [Betaproteobacteria bacterium RBG_16_58_11]
MTYPWLVPLWQRLSAQPERLPHALLLEGPRGIGKRDFALAFAHALLCETPVQDGHACGQCVACHWLAQDSHPDFRLLEPLTAEEKGEEEGATAEEGPPKRKKYEITIAQVRALADFVNLSSHRAGSRVVIIHPAEALNPAASNALLKTLEEPSPNTHFLLVSHQPHFLLPTIKSRSFSLSMPQPSPSQAAAWLKDQGIHEAELCLALAGGAPLLAREFADADYLKERRLFLSALQAPKQLNWLALAEQGARADLAARIDWLQKWLYDLVSSRLARQVRYNVDFASGLQDLAARVNLSRVQQFARELAQIKRRLQHPLNPQLLLESVLLSYLTAVN